MAGLSFLAPLFLLGAIAAAVPIVLHLVQRRTDRVVPFSAVRLLRGAPVAQHRRRRLRDVLLLALRVTALVLLAVAFARPYWVGAAGRETAPVTLVAVDTSMSLSGPGQIEAARAAARAAIAAAPAGHLVGLMGFDDRAVLVAPPSADRRAALAAVERLAPGPGGTRYRTALARAAEVLERHGGRLVVVTDLQRSGWDASDEGSLPDGVGVEVVPVPPPPGNLAVTALTREPRGVIALVHNFGERRARVTARARVDGQLLGEVIVEVAPHASAEAVFPGELPARGGVEVAIDDAEGYAADNSRFLVLDAPAASRVTILTAEAVQTTAGLYLERALEAAGGEAPFEPAIVEGRRFSADPAVHLEGRSALFVSGTRTLDRRGREAVAGYLAGGGAVLLTLGPDIDMATLRDTIGLAAGVEPDPVDAEGGATTLVPSDARHPIFRAFASPAAAFGDVDVERYRRLREEAGWRVMARFAGGAAALAERPVGAGRLVLFASDLDNRWNRFPLNPAFVPFVVELGRYLTVARATRQHWTLPDAPPGVEPRPGVHLAGVAGSAGERRVAINVDVRESDPVAMSADEFTASIGRRTGPPGPSGGVDASGLEETQRLWQAALLALLVVLAGESLLARRAV